MKTSEVLDRAADLIEERGWTPGATWDDDRYEGAPICLEGGIQAAAGISFDADTFCESLEACPAYRSVLAYLEWDDAPLYRWNDTDGRTASEVIEVLRACAVIEASRERESAPSEQVAPEPVTA